MKKFFEKIKLFFGNVWKWALAHKAAAISIAAGFVVIVTLAIVLPITLSHSGGSKPKQKKIVQATQEEYDAAFENYNKMNSFTTTTTLKDEGVSTIIVKVETHDSKAKARKSEFNGTLKAQIVEGLNLVYYYVDSDNSVSLKGRDFKETPYESIIETIKRKSYIALIGIYLTDVKDQFVYNKEIGMYEATFTKDEKEINAKIQIEDKFITYFELTEVKDARTVQVKITDINKTVVNIPESVLDSYFNYLTEAKYDSIVEKYLKMHIDSVSVKHTENEDETIYKYVIGTGYAKETEDGNTYYVVHSNSLPAIISNVGESIYKLSFTDYYDIFYNLFKYTDILTDIYYDDLEDCIEDGDYSYDHKTKSFTVSVEDFEIDEVTYKKIEIEFKNGYLTKITKETYEDDVIIDELYDYDQTDFEVPEVGYSDWSFTKNFCDAAFVNFYQLSFDTKVVEESTTHEKEYLYKDTDGKCYYLKETYDDSDNVSESEYHFVYRLTSDKEYKWIDKGEEKTTREDGSGMFNKRTLFNKLINNKLKANDFRVLDDDTFVVTVDDLDYELTFSSDYGICLAMIEFEDTGVRTTIEVELLNELFNIPTYIKSDMDKINA